MVEFKEEIVQVLVTSSCCLQLVKPGRDIADLVQVLWSDLAYVKIYQVVIVGINLSEVVPFEVVSVQVVLNMHMLMR